MLPRKFLNLGSRKCHFQRVLQDTFSKLIRRKMHPIFRVVGKVQCLRGKKRPVTPSEYGTIKGILTQRHQLSAKNVSVIPI